MKTTDQLYEELRAVIDNGNESMTHEDALDEVRALREERPSALFRPALSIDGNQWCALYGDDLQSGIAGFGDTAALAMQDFDEAWNNCKAKAAGLSVEAPNAQP